VSRGSPSTPGRRTVVIAVVWTLLFAGAVGSVMSLGAPNGTPLTDIGAVTGADGPADRPTLDVAVSRENATLVYDVTVTAPADVRHLRLDGAFGAYTVTETSGFVADRGGYRLADGREQATLTATLDLSESQRTALGTVGPDGAFQAGDDWAFAPSPRFHVRWMRGDVVHHQRLTEHQTDPAVAVDAAAPVAIGERFVFLGAHSVHTRRVDGQQVRVVVPEGTTFQVGVNRSVSLLGAVQKETGTRATGPITAFVLPEQVRSGGASSGRDVWVRADVSEVTVAHEFVHATLTLRTTSETQWLREAVAEYLAYRVAGDEESLALLAAGADGTDARTVLADPSTWPDDRVPYEHGAATLAALDGRLRAASDGDETVGTLVGRLSSQSRRGEWLTHESVVQTVWTATHDETATWFDAAATGRESWGASVRPRVANRSLAEPTAPSMAGS
jgi:hypothetical protein